MMEGQQHFARDEIIHFKTANPKSLFYGFSPIEAARYSIDTDTEMSIQRLRLLQNRAIPEGLLVSQRPLTQEDAERIRTQWNQLYQGRNQRGKLAVLDAGSFEFQRLGLSAEELEFQKGKDSVWQEIFAIYRVPLRYWVDQRQTRQLLRQQREYSSRMHKAKIGKDTGNIQQMAYAHVQGKHDNVV
jgi:HK97 family phage portal protein